MSWNPDEFDAEAIAAAEETETYSAPSEADLESALGTIESQPSNNKVSQFKKYIDVFNLYYLLLDQPLFSGGDAEAVTQVTSEVRAFITSRLEELSNIKKTQAPAVAAEKQFAEDEVKVLKLLAATAMKKHTTVPLPASPTLQTVAVKSSVAAPVVNPTASPSARPISQPAKAPAKKEAVPAAKPAKATKAGQARGTTAPKPQLRPDAYNALMTQMASDMSAGSSNILGPSPNGLTIDKGE